MDTKNKLHQRGSLTSEEQDDMFLITQLTSSMVLPMALRAVAELGVFDIIEKAGPNAKLSASEIASNLPFPTNRNLEEAHLTLDRILSFLVSHSVLTCSSQRRYGLAPIFKYFDKAGSLSASFLCITQKAFTDPWYYLKDSVLEGGIPFEKLHGISLFEYLGRDPECNQLFNTTFLGLTNMVMKKMVEIYKSFEGLMQVVDVGGGLGSSIRCITSNYTNVKGINFDLPHVIKNAPAIPGVEHVGGDMFVSVPKGDAIFMKSVLHDWGDEECIKILKNCYKALPDHGKVIVMEMIVPAVLDSSNANKALYSNDLAMLTLVHHGKERKEEEFEALAKAAGFEAVKLVCCVLNFWIIELYKIRE